MGPGRRRTKREAVENVFVFSRRLLAAGRGKVRTEISTLMERRNGVLQPTEKAKRLLRVKREAMSKHGTLISEKQAGPMRAPTQSLRACWFQR